MKQKDITWLAIALLVPQVAGFLGSLATRDAVAGWYTLIAKPSFTPPSWVFGPVWTLLFLLMGIAFFLVWKHGRGERRELAITFFIIQLGLNVMWSMVFFGLRQPGWAFVEILLLWSVIAVTICAFWRVHKSAALLLVPYIAWVSFAALLNAAIWRLNL